MSEKKQNKAWLGNILLLITAFLWGSTFVAQSETELAPFTYLAIRSYIGVIVLSPVVWVLDSIKKKSENYTKPNKDSKKALLKGGIICGIILFVSSYFQQWGISLDTGAGKAGFISAMYIIMVPVLGIFLGKKVKKLHWVCVIFAVIGLFLLCMTGNITEFSLSALFSTETFKSLSFHIGDLLVLISAFGYTLHITVIDHYVDKVDGVRLSRLQFLVTALISTVMMFIFEEPKMNEILINWFSIVYAGVLSSGVAYTLQIIGQKYTSANAATVFMSLESTFAVLSEIAYSIFVLKVPDLPTGYEWLGIVFMFVAIMVSQVPDMIKKKA